MLPEQLFKHEQLGILSFFTFTFTYNIYNNVNERYIYAHYTLICAQLVKNDAIYMKESPCGLDRKPSNNEFVLRSLTPQQLDVSRIINSAGIYTMV